MSKQEQFMLFPITPQRRKAGESVPGIQRGVRARLPSFLVIAVLVLGMLTPVGLHMLPAVAAQPTGTHFDHIVMVAMENQAYSAVIGNTNAPFTNSLAQQGTALSRDNHYSDNVNCSAGCYVEEATGAANGAGLGDGWSGPVNLPTVVDQIASVGLTWQAYCESGCPRGLDHFPWPGFSTDQNSPNIFRSSSVSTSTFIAAANSASPPNFLWFTPTDSHNMHDNSVSSGDSYLDTFLTGTGTVMTPATGSLLASNVFTNPTFHTLLVLWWDECGGGAQSCDSNSDVPNVEYGPRAGLKTNYISSSSYTTFSEVAMIEDNWGLSRLGSAAGASPVTDIFGTTGPSPIAVTFSYSPSPILVGQPTTFTASATGGTGTGYQYLWSFGGNAGSSTSNPATATFGSTGTRTITVSVTDSGAHTASATQTVNIGSSTCTGSSCNTIGSKSNPPQIVGWGGIRLDEASTHTAVGTQTTSTEASCCFTGETATNLQLLIEREQTLGYNAVRVDFDPTCTDNQDFQYMSAYSPTNAQRAITIAQHYGFWIILDYHGYVDATPATSSSFTSAGPASLVVPGYSTLQACWLGTWSTIVTQFQGSYARLVWEPLNEPSGIDMPTLSNAYQLWINQARATGDQHWIVAGNLCSNTCNFGDFSQGYPTVTDSANLVFINLHAYMGYPYISPWTNQEADSYAYQFYQWMLAGTSRTGWPAISTEIGADPLCSFTSCPNAGWGTCSSGQTCSGSAGYTTVTFEFVKYLTNLLNRNNAPIGWTAWTAGSWTDTPGTPLFGALDPTGWGTALGTISIANSTGIPPSGGFLNLLLSSPIALGLIGFVGLIAGVAAISTGRKKGRSRPAQ